MRIARLCLRTEQFAELRRFYGELLAIPLMDESADSFSLRIGASELAFQRGAAPPYHFAFNVPGKRFAAAKSWLAARASLLPMPDGGDTMRWRAWNAHACYFRDPAGNIGELIARHNLGDDGAAAGEFAAGELRGISEIGLALADVAASCRLIAEQLGLPVWDAGDGRRFRAMGNERGLLICVKRGHAWFPTSDTLAAAAPLAVDFAAAGPGGETRVLRLPGTEYALRVVG